MKRIICALVCVIFLCSCSADKMPRAVNRNISYRAHIFYYESQYDCDVVIDGDGRAEYTLKDGILEGFTACCLGDSISYSYMGKSATEPYSRSASGMFSALYEMNEFLSSSYEVKKGDGKYLINGYTSVGEFTIFLSGAGLPLSASLDGEEFYVEFYDVSLIK